MAEGTAVLTAISTVGFPIVMVLILMWYIYTMNKDHKEEMSNVTKALENNTVTMQKNTDTMQRLCDILRIDTEEGDDLK